MDLAKQFKIAEAIADYAKKQKKDKKRRELSAENMYWADVTQTRIFYIAKYTQLVQACMSSIATSDFLKGLRKQKTFLISQTVVRSNRDIIEFHDRQSWCPRCANILECCHCRNIHDIQDEEICISIQTALHSLYLQNALSLVQIDPLKCCTVKDAQETHTPTCCPSPKMGFGFGIYSKDCHLKPPE